MVTIHRIILLSLLIFYFNPVNAQIVTTPTIVTYTIGVGTGSSAVLACQNRVNAFDPSVNAVFTSATETQCNYTNIYGAQFGTITKANSCPATYSLSASQVCQKTIADCVLPQVFDTATQSCKVPCPAINEATSRLRGCTAWKACKSGCSYPAQNVKQNIITATGTLTTSNGSCTIDLLACDSFDLFTAQNLPAITVDLPPLTPEEIAAYAASAEAAAQAKADAAEQAFNDRVDSLKAAADLQAAQQAAAAASAASTAAAAAAAASAAAKAASDKAADDSAAWSAANTKAVNDALAAQAAQNDPNATQATKDAASTRATASSSAAAAAAAVKAASDAAAATAAGAATASNSVAIGTAVGAATGGGGSPQPPEFCALHPDSIICKNSSYKAGACNAGHLVGQTCKGDEIQCGMALTFNTNRCADTQRDGLNDFGDQLIRGESGVPNQTGTFENPTQLNIGQINESSFLPKSCLADLTFNVNGMPITLPLSALCEGLQVAGRIVKFFAYMLALRIIFS